MCSQILIILYPAEANAVCQIMIKLICKFEVNVNIFTCIFIKFNTFPQCQKFGYGEQCYDCLTAFFVFLINLKLREGQNASWYAG